MPHRDVQRLFPNHAGPTSTPLSFFDFLDVSGLPCSEKCALFLDYLDATGQICQPPIDHLLQVLAGATVIDPDRRNELDAAFPIPTTPSQER